MHTDGDSRRTRAKMMMTVSAVDDNHAWAIDVATAIAALPGTQAEALRLFYFEHLSDDQIAARLGLALQPARSVVADGLRRVGETLLEGHAATSTATPTGCSA